MTSPLILATNDDGIESPGLAAAVAALDPLGDLLIAAPVTQQTSMSRSRTQGGGRDGRIFRRRVTHGDRMWDGFGINATPALVVEHAVQELATRPIDLAVSGINYGENVSTCVTVSGTIGAALEAAERGIPAMAVSLETGVSQYHEYNPDIKFDVAAHFVHFFTARVLGKALPPDVHVLKIEIPASATTEAGWMVTRQDPMSYYKPVAQRRERLFEEPGRVTYDVAKGQYSEEGTDAYAMAKGLVSVTPLSLNLTSRGALGELQTLLRER